MSEVPLFPQPQKPLTERQQQRAEFLSRVEQVVLDPATDYGLTSRQIAFHLLCRFRERVSTDRVRTALTALAADKRVYVARDWVPTIPPPANTAPGRSRARRQSGRLRKLSGTYKVKAYPPHEGDKAWRQQQRSAA